MNTSRWIERSASTCTRTPRWAVWRLTQSPKCRAAASSMPATPSTSHAASAAMLAMTSLATRTAPRVAVSPIPGSLRPFQVAVRARVHADHVPGLDEKWDLDGGARVQLGRLGGAGDRVALEPGIGGLDLELDDDRQLDADQAVVVLQEVHVAAFLQEGQHVLEHVLVDRHLVVGLRVHEVVVIAVGVEVCRIVAVDANGLELVTAAEALLEDRPGQTSRSLALITAPARASLMCSTVTMDRSRPSISNIVPFRKSFVLINQKLHRMQVPVETKARDHAPRGSRREASRTPLFARVDVRDVDLDDRQPQGLQTIVEGYRIVRERARVDDDSLRAGALLLQEVDDLALVVALENGDLDVQLLRLLAHHVVEVGQRPRAVYVRLALAQQVEVRPVDDDDLLHASAFLRTLRTSPGGTSWPTSAKPMRRGSTHATRPRRAFLSVGMTARTRSTSTRGDSSGSP